MRREPKLSLCATCIALLAGCPEPAVMPAPVPPTAPPLPPEEEPIGPRFPDAPTSIQVYTEMIEAAVEDDVVDPLELERILAALAEALEVLSPAPTQLGELLLELEGLETVTPGSPAFDAIVLEVLGHTRAILARATPRHRMDMEALADAVVAYGEALEALAADEPLVEQQALLQVALRRAVTPMYIALGRVPPPLQQ